MPQIISKFKDDLQVVFLLSYYNNLMNTSFNLVLKVCIFYCSNYNRFPHIFYILPWTLLIKMLEQAVLTTLTTAVIFENNLTFSSRLRRKIFYGDCYYSYFYLWCLLIPKNLRSKLQYSTQIVKKII